MRKSLSLTAFLLAFALAAPALAEAASPPKKKPAVTRHVKRWTTPPGVRTPEQIERDQLRAWRRDRALAWRYGPRGYYYYYGEPYYNGRFGASRRNAWHVGPCWTQTPIGAMWNCGQ